MTGPRRRGGGALQHAGLNYAAIGATASADVIAFPPEGFRAAEHRHRIGSGPGRFELAGRALMTWGALRGAGLEVGEIRAERASEPRFLPDGTPWITAGMSAAVRADPSGPVEPVTVVTVIDDPGRIGYVYGSGLGARECVERLLLVEHDSDDAVRVVLRSIWRSSGSRWSPAARRVDARQRRLDERLVRALHPSNAA